MVTLQPLYLVLGMHAFGRLVGATLVLGTLMTIATLNGAQGQSKTQREIRSCGGPAKTLAQCLKVCACLEGNDCKRYCDNIYKR